MIRLHDTWPYNDSDPEPRISLWEILALGLVFAVIVVVTVVTVTVFGGL